jgi:hypothetical protein
MNRKSVLVSVALLAFAVLPYGSAFGGRIVPWGKYDERCRRVPSGKDFVSIALEAGGNERLVVSALLGNVKQ